MYWYALVASFTDAWIETLRYLACGEYGSSHLLQMRGLKLNREGYRTRRQEVASFTDAWIETLNNLSLKYGNNVASFTDAWIETGLALLKAGIGESHLLQMRGLKPRSQLYHPAKFGRIFYRCVD